MASGPSATTLAKSSWSMPSASHSERTSLIATVAEVIQALTAILTALPSAPLPRYSTAEPSCLNVGSASSNAARLPDVNQTSVPSRAGPVLPDTGASK
jgi:hypothetical protein